ncbi:MAG: Winged helix DNA-binding protein [Mucilaginibacter sp.]|nr:Winged helix DNA-binding protein [Mucilaginibacter sp.]
MTENDILKFRLSNHLITQGKLNTPESVVSWMGAMQAQDYGQAKYAIGSRTVNPKNSDIEQAINEKRIVRIWALRGTLHILAAADIHWMLPLVTSGIISRNQSQFKKLSLGDDDFTKIHRCLVQLLQGGKQLTRAALFEGLEQNGINTIGLRGAFILYKAGWLGIICLGPMKAKQDTYTLLEEWLPKRYTISREEALAKLAERYLQSHGPATLKDFILWSGLSITEARAGFELIREKLTRIEVNDQLYWMVGNNSGADILLGNRYLLAGFDEYLLGYKDRSLLLDAADTKKVILKNGIFKPIIVENGKIIGTWNRLIGKSKISIETDVFDGTVHQSDFLANEIKRYISFANS